MSNYDDPYRTDGGQFIVHTSGANQWEQANAGVNWNDSFTTAQYKVENQRRAFGLDPLTGLPPSRPYATNWSGGGAGWATSHTRDESQLLPVLWGVCKALVMVPLSLALVAGIAAFGAKAVDAPHLARRAAQGEFAAYAPAPLTSYFSERELSAPNDPAKMLASLYAHRADKKNDPQQLRAHALMGQAYRCLLQLGCRDAVARTDARAASRLLFVASGFFLPLIVKGNESAARDMCLFALKLGTDHQDVLSARSHCAQALNAKPDSAAARHALTQLDQSWTLRLAEFYEWLAQTQRSWAA